MLDNLTDEATDMCFFRRMLRIQMNKHVDNNEKGNGNETCLKSGRDR